VTPPPATGPDNLARARPAAPRALVTGPAAWGKIADAMPGEFDFISWLRGQQRRTALVPVPAGDDLAVVRWPVADLLLVGVDQVLDGVHFDSAVHAPRLIGAKVMNRNLSDCAAMACLPAVAVVAAALPAGRSLEYAKELYLGMQEAGRAFDCEIVGGDTGTWAGRLAVSVTILGRSAGVEPVTRAGARPGDGIYVTGPLGGSLHLTGAAEEGLRAGRHMTFTPRVALARDLAARYRVTAMMDLSDGLSRDLGHICAASKVGAVIDAARVPVHGHAIAHGGDALMRALNDGEDYELVLTSPDAISEELATRVGEIRAGGGVVLVREGREEALAPRGWEHSL